MVIDRAINLPVTSGIIHLLGVFQATANRIIVITPPDSATLPQICSKLSYDLVNYGSAGIVSDGKEIPKRDIVIHERKPNASFP